MALDFGAAGYNLGADWTAPEQVVEQQQQSQTNHLPGSMTALGPVLGATAGWAVDSGSPHLADGVLTVRGDSRVFLVQDYRATNWSDQKYVRVDMLVHDFSFTADLSGVPCGCLACVYLVAMKDPDATGSRYCDMAENVAPGWRDGLCTELDLFEANSHSMQTAIHTQARLLV